MHSEEARLDGGDGGARPEGAPTQGDLIERATAELKRRVDSGTSSDLAEIVHPGTGEVVLATPDERVMLLVGQAHDLLDEAQTLAETLHAATLAGLVRDVARLVKASDIAKGKALAVEVRAKIRVAEEYDAAQAKGEAATNRGEVNQHVMREGAQAPGTLPATLKEIGLDSRRLSEWRKLAERGARSCLQLIDKILAEGREPTYAEVLRGGNVGLNALKAFSGNNEWYTPGHLIEAAREVLGEIDLDPASCDAAQEVVKARHHFTAEDDGLTKEWRGRVWMNPPYAAGLIDRFAAKLVAEHEAGHVPAAVVLVDDRTDTGWFHQLAGACSRVCFTRGRVKFYNAATGSEGSAPANGSAIFYFGNEPERFERVFDRFGAPAAFTQAKGEAPADVLVAA